MLELLKQINNKLIVEYKNSPEKLKVQHQIKQILTEQDCFLKMPIEIAYSILRDLNINEKKLKVTYLLLIENKK